MAEAVPREIFGDRRFAEGAEELVNPLPEANGFAVGDEEGAAARDRQLRAGKGLLGENMGVDGVGDVDHVDRVLAITDDAQAPGAGAGEHAGDEVRVADAPDEVGRGARPCEEWQSWRRGLRARRWLW